MDAPHRGAEDATMDPGQMAAVGVVFVLAGAVKGVTGMGLPTVAVSLLGLWLAPAQAAALLVLPSLATNLAQCLGPQARRLAALLWPAWLGLAVLTIATPDLGRLAGPVQPRQLLGGVLLLYGLWGLWRPQPPDLSHAPRWAVALVGAATGLVTAATAVFAVPLVPYLQTLRLEKDALVQALGLSFMVATLALAVRVNLAGGPWLTAPAVGALAAAFAGLWLGSRVRHRLSGPAFQRGLYLMFMLLGLANLLRGG
jgi:uncharacterized membrane protein YfcA